MKKYLLLFILAVTLLAGCTPHERGDIGEPVSQEFYYCKTAYNKQPFAVLFDVEDFDGRTVTFAVDPEADYSDGFYSTKIEPNTFLQYKFTKDEYMKYVGGLSVFEASFFVYTFVIPEEGDAEYVTVITESDDIGAAFRKAKGLKGDIKPLDEEYLKKWKFTYYKI